MPCVAIHRPSGDLLALRACGNATEDLSRFQRPLNMGGLAPGGAASRSRAQRRGRAGDRVRRAFDPHGARSGAILAAMSEENLEIVLAAYRDPGPLTEHRSLARDAEFDFSEVYPDQPVLHGVEQMRRFRDESPWGRSLHFELERCFDVDNERVLVFVRATSTGQSSGAAVEGRVAQEV